MGKLKDEWITCAEAARIMSENSKHPVAEAYVRQLAITGKIRKKAVDGRTNLYLKRDAEGYIVQQFNWKAKKKMWTSEALAS